MDEFLWGRKWSKLSEKGSWTEAKGAPPIAVLHMQYSLYVWRTSQNFMGKINTCTFRTLKAQQRSPSNRQKFPLFSLTRILYLSFTRLLLSCCIFLNLANVLWNNTPSERLGSPAPHSPRPHPPPPKASRSDREPQKIQVDNWGLFFSGDLRRHSVHSGLTRWWPIILRVLDASVVN